MFNVTLEGDAATVAALEEMPGAVRQALAATVTDLTQALWAHVKGDKLQGQVLRHVTGALDASVKFEAPIMEGDSVVGRVTQDSSVAYGRVHEYGLTVSRVSKLGNAFSVTYPERSFMRSSLEDERAHITDALNAAVGEGLRAPFEGRR